MLVVDCDTDVTVLMERNINAVTDSVEGGGEPFDVSHF